MRHFFSIGIIWWIEDQDDDPHEISFRGVAYAADGMMDDVLRG